MKHDRKAARSLDQGFFGRVFTSYDKIEENFENGVIRSMSDKVHVSRAMASVRRAVSQSIEDSAILRAVRDVMSQLPWQSVRSYGVFLLSFGLYTSIIFAIKAIASSLTADVDSLIFGVLALVVSAPLLSSGKTLAEAVMTSRISSYIAFDILGYRREDGMSRKKPRQRLDLAFLGGMISGLLTFYFEPSRILGVIVSTVLLYVVMSKPESGLLLLFAVFPFMSDRTLCVCVLIVAISYLTKLVCGRRTVRFDACDALVLIFFFLIVFGTLINYGAGTGASHSSDLRRIVYMTIYFLTCNLIKNANWRSRMMRALLFGGSSVAVVSLLSLLGGTITTLTADVTSHGIEALTNYCTQIFDGASASSYYLAMMLPVLIAYVLRRGTGGKRVNMVFFLLIVLAAAVMTMSRGLWLGLFTGVAVMLMIIDMRFAWGAVGVAVAVPVVTMLLPDGAKAWVSTILDNSGRLTQNRVQVRAVSSRIFLDNIIGGIGSGSGVFESVYENRTPVGAYASNSQSLFLQVGVELGIVGLFVFAAAMTFMLIKSLTCARFGEDDSRRLCAGALSAGLAASLCSGLSNYIWVDDRMFLLFWMFAGALSAYTTGGGQKKEHVYTETTISGDGSSATADIVF